MELCSIHNVENPLEKQGISGSGGDPVIWIWMVQKDLEVLFHLFSWVHKNEEMG